MKKLGIFAIVLCLLVSLLSSFAMADEEKTTIVIGATDSPHAEVLDLVREDLKELGYDLDIVVFTEYPLPNPALSNKELDANYFQHIPYLNDYNETLPDEEKLVPAIAVHYEPYCLYAGKTASIEELKEGAVIAITNDPANEIRALLLLQEAGLITLPEDANPDSKYTAFDVVENPLKIDLREIDASQLPATLQDVDMAVINGNFAIPAGLSPAEDSVFMEAADSEAGVVYTNYVVIRPEDVDAPWVEALRTVLQSEKVYNYLLTEEKYQGGVIPAFSVEETAE